MKKYVIILFLPLVFCAKPERKPIPSPVNLTHIMSLVDSMVVDEERIAFVYIYSEYPYYKPVPAPDEGIACVDDAGRFMEVLETEIIEHNRIDLISLSKDIMRFLLYMSRNDGLWYNFILKNGDINTTHRNSVAEFGWWAIRGLRGLASGYRILKETGVDSVLYNRLRERIESARIHIEAAHKYYPDVVDVDSITRPLWLIKSAPDMNAELLLALIKLHQTGDFDFSDEIRKIAEGLIEHQFRDRSHELNGMYFCWQNLWHNWGNNQAYALISAFNAVGDSSCFYSVQEWAEYFIPFLIERNFPNEILLFPDGEYSVKDYPQIAYGFCSIYSGIRSYAELTGNRAAAKHSERVFSWFKGGNEPGVQMYIPEKGLCYDGISYLTSLNMNSGAESTIEALLAIQRRGAF